MKNIQTRNGRVVQSRFDDDGEAFARLTELYDQKKIHGNFVIDLLYRTFLRLTDEQRRWVHVLVSDTEARIEQEKAAGPVGLLVIEMFDHASESLQFPKVRFLDFVLKRLGERSRTPGAVAIIRKVDNSFIGRIDRDGVIRWLVGMLVVQVIRDRLEAFCKNPVAEAQLEGQYLGSCCFCGLELTDRRSLATGYGPICASKYGLPWGQPALEEECA